MPGSISLYLALAIMGFFLGSVMFALILPRHFKGIDIRKLSDDGNPGTANAVKYGGVALGLLCLLGDLLKAGLPVYLARRFCGMEHPLFALVMAAPVLGHAFSPFLGGRGGKAIAPAFGVLAALLPADLSVGVLAIAFIFFSLVVVITPNRLRTIAAFAVLTIYSILVNQHGSVALGCILLSATVVLKHWRPLPQEVPGISLFGRHNPA